MPFLASLHLNEFALASLHKTILNDSSSNFNLRGPLRILPTIKDTRSVMSYFIFPITGSNETVDWHSCVVTTHLLVPFFATFKQQPVHIDWSDHFMYKYPFVLLLLNGYNKVPASEQEM